MSWWILLTGIVIGVCVGRAYGWMKYHYPESQEMIRVKIEQQRLRRLRVQEQQEIVRARIDKSLSERINQ
jgi:hypothetical protein